MVLTVVLLATSCAARVDTGGEAAPTASVAQSSPDLSPSDQPASDEPATGSPTPLPTGAGDRTEVLIVVTRAPGTLELRSVSSATRASRLLRTLAPPQDGAQVVDVAMTADRDPLVCATWHTGPGELSADLETSLVCYPGGAEIGQRVSGVERPLQVAMHPDGERIAWSLASAGEQNPVFTTAVLQDGTVSSVERRRGYADRPDDAFTGTDIQDLAWSDDSHVVVSTSVQSDDGPRLHEVDVAAPAGRGWLQDSHEVPVPEDDTGYTTYDSVRSARDGRALADQRGYGLDEDPPPDRAVLIDLESGRVLQVLATAAEGRYLVGVSGTPEAVVYVTAAGETDVKAYLRLRGEDKGTAITGLPDDTEDVLAQHV